MVDCWQSFVPSQTKRGPNGVLLCCSKSIWPALPVVISVGRWSICAVTIDAGDRGRVARLAVEHAVAVHIDIEMAIDALHSVREMHVFQMNCLGEFLRIIVRDLVVVEIEQVAFAIVFEDRAKDPAVSVIIGKLRVLQLRI